MNYRVILSPDAKSDISSAVRWYQQRDPKLAFRFMLEVLAIRRRISQYPYQFPLINGTVRRALLNGFPYSVYYSLDNRAISVLAILHQRRANTLLLDRGNGRN
jgi:plasmid stabilization system protein ParE